MANTTDYDLELCKEICELVAAGGNISAVLASNKDFPAWSTFRRWKLEHPELQTLYTRAIQDKAEMVDSEIDATMQDCKEGKIDVPTARLLIDTLKWKAAKYYPKMFGEKIQQEHSGEIKGGSRVNLSKVSDAALAELDNAIEDEQPDS